MKGLYRAGVPANAAADALRMVGVFVRVYLHLTDFGTNTAIDTGFLVHPITKYRYGIKNRINGSKGTDVFAKRAVNQNG